MPEFLLSGPSLYRGFPFQPAACRFGWPVSRHRIREIVGPEQGVFKAEQGTERGIAGSLCVLTMAQYAMQLRQFSRRPSRRRVSSGEFGRNAQRSQRLDRVPGVAVMDEDA